MARAALCGALIAPLAGCGAGGWFSDGPPSAEGVDGREGAAKTFSDVQLSGALLADDAFAERARPTDTAVGLFNKSFGRGDWGSCARGKDANEELLGLRGASAQQVLAFDAGADEGGGGADEGAGGADEAGGGAGELGSVSDQTAAPRPPVSQRLVSLRPAEAGRYLELQRRLGELCPTTMEDTEAAPITRHHSVKKLPRIGDEAILETSRIPGSNEYDHRPQYTAEVRVGGVLVTVSAGTDEGRTVEAAAKAVDRVRAELYG
ncbi:hypothetical protein [Streptomyces sp. NPDC059009]|uniref:hypothetical protein n=1 Tax=Streptomyces sp. NPDC059009 TaxID=3346694 RepID=UPI0036885979